MSISRKDFLMAGSMALSSLALGSLVSCKKKPAEMKDQYLRLKNPASPTELEQKHVPGIDAPASAKANEKIEITVKMGYMKEHPSTKEHYIKFIKLLVDGKEAGSKEWKEGGEKPVANFSITLAKSAKIEAIADCNLHGLWISEAKQISVA